MRVTFGTKYNQMGYYQNVMQNKINEQNAKIASGLKIRYGYEDSSVFNQNLKFEYEETTLNQGIDVANDALNYTLNTDKALTELSLTATNFNTKLIQAATDIHSPTSREAIARDLEKLRDHMINIANTSIGGEFIFSGSAVTVRPFSDDGEYHGNSEQLKALISSQNALPYNVNGADLFFGQDLDHHKSITTNIKKLNQRKLTPDIMDQINRGEAPAEVFIKNTDTLRDFIGDIDRDPKNSPPEFFYIRGVRPDGTSFKEKFSFDTAYENEKSAARVQDVLDRIGRAFGNTPENQVVSVSMNFWGQIEIKSLKAGNAKLEFHMISSDMDVDNLDDLPALGARITSYQKSPYLGDFSQMHIRSAQDRADHRIHRMPGTFLTTQNMPAENYTPLSELFSHDTKFLQIGGFRPNTDDGEPDDRPLDVLTIEIEGKNVQDLLELIKQHFGGNLDARIANGELVIVDNNVKNISTDMKEPPFDGPTNFTLGMATLDENGLENYGIRADYKMEYDRVAFEKKGAVLRANVAQVKQGGEVMADESTRISEVVGGDLTGQIYNLALKDHNGEPLRAEIRFSQYGTFLALPKGGSLDMEEAILIPLYNPHDEPPEVSVTKPNEVTYRQLFDAISIALNYSNQDVNNLYATEFDGVGEQAAKDAYEELLTQARRNMEIGFNRDGMMEIKDATRSITRMQFMISNALSNDFSAEAIRDDRNFLSLHANNAITIDTPKTNFIASLDEMIKAVREGIYRPGAKDLEYHSDMRNGGIQNAITRMAHLSDHIEKIIALNGSYGKSFENAIRRNEVLKVQIASLKTDTIGTDIAETYNHFNNLTNNYNAVLASTSRINQLSLVNYL